MIKQLMNVIIIVIVNDSMLIKYLQLNGKYAINSENNTFRLPFMFAAVQMEQFEINTQQEKLLFIELFTIDAKVDVSFEKMKIV